MYELVITLKEKCFTKYKLKFFHCLGINTKEKYTKSC